LNKNNNDKNLPSVESVVLPKSDQEITTHNIDEVFTEQENSDIMEPNHDLNYSEEIIRNIKNMNKENTGN